MRASIDFGRDPSAVGRQPVPLCHVNLPGLRPDATGLTASRQ
jgi:hypothetical protein